MLRFPAYGNRSQPYKQQYGLGVADRAVRTEADLVLPQGQEYVGTTAVSGIPLGNALHRVPSRET